ncbi:UPF0545 protein C22orf39 homolog isoform X3 [Corvus kubaryi]|uniref:UPF0545 protein C22orf39 homolog isoform X3 n=1 Tax=Corvus kubaryi TaxID=68294 RepID=UPI001C04879D|nr:UPF0545 protein C22orf39 homolog isoform X3 [Corvus kubaryi]
MAGAGGSWRPPRSCEDYWGEWKHCRGLRHAFHHYYAHGELPDCGRWREDYEACRAWERDRAAAAQAKVIPGVSRNAAGYSPADTGAHEPCGTGYSGTPPSSQPGQLLAETVPQEW